MVRTVCAVGLAAFCLTWAASAVADVGVRYTVDEKALRTGATEGTSLTFTLYADGACTSQIGSPVTITLGNVALIERLKRLTPPGGTRPPATDRLTHVLVGVTPPSIAFLTVTGSGITPVGGACQFQFSSPGGPVSVPCLSQVGTEVYFTGCNVNVRSGSGSTDAPVNGLGNLIVGYNANDGARYRPGSHNIVVGDQQTYQSYGGLVAGVANTISAPWASVTGGNCNVAGYGAAPQQGCVNADSGPVAASVSGGAGNVASGTVASVSGGSGNIAGGNAASVSGGFANSATGFDASVSGGVANLAGPDPNTTVSGPTGESVSGGACNVAGSGTPSSECSQIDFSAASVSGGTHNAASGHRASISGGHDNIVGGTNASVSGGGPFIHVYTNEWHAGQSGGFPTGTEY